MSQTLAEGVEKQILKEAVRAAEICKSNSKSRWARIHQAPPPGHHDCLEGRLLELQPNQGCCNILSWTSELWMADQTILFADHFIPAEAEHLNQNEATIEVSDTTQDYIGPWNGWLNPASLIVLFLKYAWNYRPRTTDKVHLKQTLVTTRWQYVWSKFLIYIQLKCYKWHPFLRCGQGCLCQNSNRNSLHCAQNRSSTKHTVSSYFRTYLKVDMESYFDKWRSFVSSQHAKYSSLIR